MRELHVWSNRPIWPQGLNRPAGEDPVPSTLDWNLWIGPAPMRPFKQGVYHAFNWRGWYDFGTGALGDMACHTVNMPFRALKLGYPDVVECEKTSPMFKETFPKTSRIRFEFPKREGLVPLKFWWYDGNPDDKAVPPLRPNPQLTKEITEMNGKLPGSGCLLVGDKGGLFSPDDSASQLYLMMRGEKEYKSANNHEAVQGVPWTIPRSPGHNEEWFRMMRDGTPAYSNFDIAPRLHLCWLADVRARLRHQRRGSARQMVQAGLFGHLTYAERGYVHDCRALAFKPDGPEPRCIFAGMDWRVRVETRQASVGGQERCVCVLQTEPASLGHGRGPEPFPSSSRTES